MMSKNEKKWLLNCSIVIVILILVYLIVYTSEKEHENNRFYDSCYQACSDAMEGNPAKK